MTKVPFLDLAAGYAELTWDPRGFGQSGGVAEVDAPSAEGRDVSALIDKVLTGRPEIAVDSDHFYELLLAKHGTYVGPGHWFEVDDRHFRLGFGWPSEGELRAGLAALSSAATA